jgi:plasmid stabilization system protein ParE
MPCLNWSPRALADVRRLYRFLAPKNPGAARRAVQAIRTRVRFLARFPEAGRRAEKRGAGRREFLVPFGDEGYVVLYRFNGDEILLIAVRHMREADYQPLSGS